MWGNSESLLTVEDDDDNMLSTSKGKQKSITAQAHFSVNDKHYEILSSHRDSNPITATAVKRANQYTIAKHYHTKKHACMCAHVRVC